MEILGLPLHPLIVHLTVVLVPLAGLGGVVVAAVKWARVRYGWLVVAAAAAALASNIVTQLSGTAFAETFQRHTPQMEHHFELGNDLLPWTIVLFVGTVAVMMGQRVVTRGDRIGNLILLAGIALTVVGGIVSVIQVARIAHAGAVAVWGG